MSVLFVFIDCVRLDESQRHYDRTEADHSEDGSAKNKQADDDGDESISVAATSRSATPAVRTGTRSLTNPRTAAAVTIQTRPSRVQRGLKKAAERAAAAALAKTTSGKRLSKKDQKAQVAAEKVPTGYWELYEVYILDLFEEYEDNPKGYARYEHPSFACNLTVRLHLQSHIAELQSEDDALFGVSQGVGPRVISAPGFAPQAASSVPPAASQTSALDRFLRTSNTSR